MQVMSETYQRAMQTDTSPSLKPEKIGVEPPIEVRLNRQLREKVATLGGLRGMAREDPLKLAHAINNLIEKF